MSYSFIKNDNTSFANYSRVYEVYNFNTPRYLRIALVIGYLTGIEKYFITILGDNLLKENYNLAYEDIGDTEFIQMLNEFFNFISLMSPEDFIGDEYHLSPSELPSLTKDNFVVYVSDVEPYYDEDLEEHDGIWSISDNHSNYLLDNQIIIPMWLENYDTDEYQPYNFNDVLDLYYDDIEMSLYCTIDYELLNTYAIS